MPKLEEEPMTLIQVRLFDSDLKILRTLFGQQFGVNRAVRTIVRTYLRQVESKTAEIIDATDATDEALETEAAGVLDTLL